MFTFPSGEVCPNLKNSSRFLHSLLKIFCLKGELFTQLRSRVIIVLGMCALRKFYLPPTAVLSQYLMAFCYSARIIVTVCVLCSMCVFELLFFPFSFRFCIVSKRYLLRVCCYTRVRRGSVRKNVLNRYNNLRLYFWNPLYFQSKYFI